MYNRALFYLTIILSLCILGVKTEAANLPTDFNYAKFQSLVKSAVRIGQPMNIGGNDYRVLKRIVPSTISKSHRADYFSAVGIEETHGGFTVLHIEEVSEIWRKRSNGDWEIEQWVWMADSSGELFSIYHGMLSEKADGQVLQSEILPVGKPNDPTELARWGTKLLEWSGYLKMQGEY